MRYEDLRETLEKTGMTQYEADAYITVLELGSAPATAIADACSVPQARIYDVLRELEGEGCIETYQDGSLHARARDPADVQKRLERHADTVAVAAAEIEKRWNQPTVENHRVSVVKPLSAIYERAREVIDDAENELLLAVTPETLAPCRDRLAEAVDRGVVVKLALTPDDADEHPADPPAIDFSGIATEVRYRRLPTPFLVIGDKTRVRYAPEMTLHAAHEYGVLVNDYSLSRVFDWYFQTALWKSWEPIYSVRTDGPAVYTSIRECIDHIESLAETGETVPLTVIGQERGTQQTREWTGNVIGYESFQLEWERVTPLESFVEEATIELDVDGERYTVGGWGALVEDIEGERFVVGANR
ncbi:TrmB family transcriptional regulator [Haloferacaceae archaeon DSL9]